MTNTLNQSQRVAVATKSQSRRGDKGSASQNPRSNEALLNEWESSMRSVNHPWVKDWDVNDQSHSEMRTIGHTPTTSDNGDVESDCGACMRTDTSSESMPTHTSPTALDKLIREGKVLETLSPEPQEYVKRVATQERSETQEAAQS